MVSTVKFLACCLVSAVSFPAIFLGSVVFQYAKAALPPGIDQPLKIRFLYTLLLSTVALVGSPVFHNSETSPVMKGGGFCKKGWSSHDFSIICKMGLPNWLNVQASYEALQQATTVGTLFLSSQSS